MCGRYVSPSEQDIERFWDLPGSDRRFPAQYNVAPTMPVPIVHRDQHAGGAKSVTLARWGLIPFFWKAAKPPGHSFNARLEEAADKPMWRLPFRNARCIVPASGWYEWQEREQVNRETGELNKYKQPYFMHLPENRLLGLAGLMAWTKAAGSDQWTASCTILTTAASGSAAQIHHRMPVALMEAAHDAWLDPNLNDPEAVQALIAEHQLALAIAKHAVSTRVNGSRTDDASLIDSVPPLHPDTPKPFTA
ncbi:MAG: SOS response-associated peptidase [Casimicrobiaceae bacterium]